MAIKYAVNLKYDLIFDFITDGQVEQSDIIGALLTLSSSYDLNYGITKLQNMNKIGKLKIKRQVFQQKNDFKTKGTIQVPIDLDRAQVAIFAAILENITRIKLYESKITLRKIVNEQKINNTKLLNRAVEIYTTYFENETTSPESLKKTLFELTSSKKAVSCEQFTLGSSFYNSENTIVVQGRADVLVLSDCNITNTFALGGVDFSPSKVIEFLKNKKITLFRDGDQGGKQIQRRLTSILEVTYVIQIPKNKSVEDLSKAQIFELIRSRRLYSP